MKHFFLFLLLMVIIGMCSFSAFGQDFIAEVNTIKENAIKEGDLNIHQAIKIKFIEGSPFFMSFIALALIIGLSFCLERIIYLNLLQIDTRKFLSEVEKHLEKGDVEKSKDVARNTRGPVASICYQALVRSEENIEVIDKSITSYGSVQAGLMEKNLSWITLFIAAAPSLGFLGTVIGMIQSFDEIQQYGDINPTIVAGGMKFALITTVGGLIVALILQFFYNYILNKMEGILNSMENDSIVILDMLMRYKKKYRK
ncbi:MotA/TolQ/ExbB proton channel family protein [Bacteroidales bacterium OttesenSCG-928-M06]|nr:MotA/TolQ/ExbB proton channel family protein [Bacteroidales bacterium OttesenSCG-928-M06]